MRDILFSPYLSYYKYPVGSVEVNSEVTFTIKITKSYDIYNLMINLFNDNNEEVITKPLYYVYDNDDSYNTFQVKASFSHPYLYWYHFSFDDCYGHHFIGRDNELNAKLYDNDIRNFQLNVYNGTDSDFSWFQGKVMYQIYPDRFCVGDVRRYKDGAYNYKDEKEDVRWEPFNGVYCNDFYGGNFEGIREKLDYLKELGVGIIYLNPITLSPTSHRYDTSDYLKIDDVLGSEEDFIRLIKDAGKRGIKVVIDGVYNHTGSDSVYFNKEGHFDSVGAYQSKKSSYYSWYKFINFPKKYDSWWGIETLPSVNQESGFVDFITGDDGVINHYMKMGIKGIRLDVVDELNDNFVRRINSVIKKCDKDAITIGEVWEDASSKIAYGKRKQYFDGSELDSVMNYPLKNAIIDFLGHDNLEHLVIYMREEVNNYSPKVLNSMMNVLSTHDLPRLISVFSGVDFNSLSKRESSMVSMTTTEYFKARQLLKMAYMISYTMPGVPSLYYGDELGMEGGKDPFCRRMMKWDDGDYELCNYFKKLGKMRSRKDTCDVFKKGEYNEISHCNNVFIYERKNELSRVLVIINNSSYDYYYHLTKGIDLLEDKEITDGVVVEPKNCCAVLIK